MKTLKRILVTILIVLGLGFAVLYIPSTIERKHFNDRLEIADAMFVERCKKSGVFIHKTVEDVEGLFLMKLRPDVVNYGNQFRLDDPYGKDVRGDRYIKSFLRGGHGTSHESSTIEGVPPKPNGYHYVDGIDPTDGVRYRYTGSIKDIVKRSSFIGGGSGKTFVVKAFSLDKTPVLDDFPRYGVTYDDISTREEREYWIAGSSLKVIDLETDEIIAERIGYMMDYAQGSNAGNRSPWLFAANNACPTFQRNSLDQPKNGSSAQLWQTVYFVEQVLIPKQEKSHD